MRPILKPDDQGTEFVGVRVEDIQEMARSSWTFSKLRISSRIRPSRYCRRHRPTSRGSSARNGSGKPPLSRNCSSPAAIPARVASAGETGCRRCRKYLPAKLSPDRRKVSSRALPVTKMHRAGPVPSLESLAAL